MLQMFYRHREASMYTLYLTINTTFLFDKSYSYVWIRWCLPLSYTAIDLGCWVFPMMNWTFLLHSPLFTFIPLYIYTSNWGDLLATKATKRRLQVAASWAIHIFPSWLIVKVGNSWAMWCHMRKLYRGKPEHIGWSAVYQMHFNW